MDNTGSAFLNGVNLSALLLTTLFGWILQDLDLVLSVLTKIASLLTFIIFFFLNKDTFFLKVKETISKLKKKKK